LQSSAWSDFLQATATDQSITSPFWTHNKAPASCAATW